MYPEEELIFEVIPNSGNGVQLKTKWFVRVAKEMVITDDNGRENEDGLIFRAKRLINEVMGIDEQQT